MVLFRGRGDSGRMAKIEAMTSDLDIWRSANLLVKQHGEDAPIEAASRGPALELFRIPPIELGSHHGDRALDLGR